MISKDIFLRRILVSPFLILIPFFLLTVGPCSAREAQSEEEIENFENIVVTAGKMETEVSKTPTDITVITREEIESYPGVTTVMDLLHQIQVPGVYIPYNLPTDGNISVRGGEISRWAVEILVNGVEFNKSNGLVEPARIPIHDVERIEMIKTPSSVYGDQAIGGVINIVTRDAEKPLEAKIGLSAGGFGSEKGYAVINGKSNKWRYFLDVGMSRFDAYQDRVYENDNNVFAKLEYDFDDDSSLAFQGSHFDSTGNYLNPMTLAQFDENPRQNPGLDNDFEADYNLAALVYSKSFGNSDLVAKFDFKNDLYKIFYYEWFYKYDEWEAHPEITFTHHHHLASMANQIVIGVEYRHHHRDMDVYDAPGNVIGTQYGDREKKEDTYAAYVQDELSITDALTVTVGLRYDNYKQEQIGKISSKATWTQSDDAFSPKLGATYAFSNAFNLFAGFNSGFKSPARVPAAASSEDLKPEKIYAYEVGLRGNPAPWVDYGIAFFLNDAEDKFVRTGLVSYKNAGKTRSKGVELSVNTRFSNGIYASISYTWQDSKYVDYQISGVSYNGNYIPNVPNQMGGIKIGYQNEIWGDFTINPAFTGKKYLNDSNTMKWDGYWVLNARYAKKFTAWYPNVEFFVSGQNLTGQDEVLYNEITAGNGTQSVFSLPGRSIYVGVNVVF